MAGLKKIVSWIFPVAVKRVEGKVSPLLEISLENGRKVLNTGNVNYSFGALHDVFRIALQKAKIVEHPPQQVLILGFGAGSIATIIVDEYGQHPEMIGVEADPVVIHLAKTEFNSDRFDSLEIENTTAESFITKNKKQFDLIAVDVFVEAVVPESCRSDIFLDGLHKSLNNGGRVVFNVMPEATFANGDDFTERFKCKFQNVETHELHLGDAKNVILIGYKN